MNVFIIKHNVAKQFVYSVIIFAVHWFLFQNCGNLRQFVDLFII